MSQLNPGVGVNPPPSISGPALDDEAADFATLLLRAAKLSAADGVDGDTFMRAAWRACLKARPELRDQLVDKELRSKLRDLRKRGLIDMA